MNDDELDENLIDEDRRGPALPLDHPSQDSDVDPTESYHLSDNLESDGPSPLDPFLGGDSVRRQELY